MEDTPSPSDSASSYYSAPSPPGPAAAPREGDQQDQGDNELAAALSLLALDTAKPRPQPQAQPQVASQLPPASLAQIHPVVLPTSAEQSSTIHSSLPPPALLSAVNSSSSIQKASSSLPSPFRTCIIFQDECENHVYTRDSNTAAIVERPERIRAVKVGVASAFSRLEARGINQGKLDKWDPAGPNGSEGEGEANGEELARKLEELTVSASDSKGKGKGKEIIGGPFDILSSDAKMAVDDPALLFIHPYPNVPPSTPSPPPSTAPATPSKSTKSSSPDPDSLPPWPTQLQELCRNSSLAISQPPHSEIPSHLPQGDLYLSPGSEGAIYGGLGAMCEAVDKVVIGEKEGKGYDRAFVAIRPPGHHCTTKDPMGFCFIANVAVAAAHAHQKHGIHRVVILDIDLHHGNGTQEIAYRINAAANSASIVASRKPISPRKGSPSKAAAAAAAAAAAESKPHDLQIMYASLHDVFSYPCEDGDPALVQAASVNLSGGHGQYISNVHLESWQHEAEFHERLYHKYRDGLLGSAKEFCEKTAVEENEAARTLVIISAGFDASEHESQGMSRHKRNVPTSFYHRFARDAVKFANDQAGGKVVAVLEGGYSDRALASATMATVVGLAETPRSLEKTFLLEEGGELKWWEEKTLLKLEKATKKTLSGKVSGPPGMGAEPWLERTVEIFARIEGSEVEVKGEKKEKERERETKPMQLRERRPRTHPFGSEDSTPVPSPTKRSVSSTRGRGAKSVVPPVPPPAIPSFLTGDEMTESVPVPEEKVKQEEGEQDKGGLKVNHVHTLRHFSSIQPPQNSMGAPSGNGGLRANSGTSTPRSLDFNESTFLLSGHQGQGADGIEYGTTDAQEAEAIRGLPARLARSASIARKAARKQRRTTQWKSLKTRAKYYVPVLQWLPQYSIGAFAGDVTAAFTLASLVVPQSMSYATNLAGLDPVTGLFGAAIPPMVYALLGTCRQLSVGPEAALSLITGQTIVSMVTAEVHAHPDMTDASKAKLAILISTILTFEAGLVRTVSKSILGLMRLGFLDAVLSRALLRGFITAVGLVIFVGQVIPIFGLEKALAAAGGAETFLEKIGFIIEHLEDTHFLTLVISLVSMAFLVLAKMFKGRLVQRRGFRWLAYIPDAIFDWDKAGVQVLGKVSAGSVQIRLPFLNAGGYLGKCLGTACVIAILGFLDSIVGAKDCASRYDYPISPNRELVAIGAANVATSLFSGSLPGYGSITRSRLAGSTGATTQMTSLLTGAIVLLVTFFLLGFLYTLPKAILAVIICVVVFSILAEVPHDVKFFWKMHAWVDFGLMLGTFLLTAFIGVEVGITVSVAVSLLLCIKQSASMRIKILGRVPQTNFYEPLDEDDEDEGLLGSQEEIPGVLIVRLRDASLHFANAGALKERLRRLERYGKGRHHPSDQPRRGEASVIIFHLADVEDVDASALQLILEVVEAYVSRSVLVYWCGAQPQVLARLGKAGVLKASGDESHVQPTVQKALDSLSDTMLTLSV
ncbi:sulfate transporter [Pseudohyphozyma bogoriensis]|nr:sulfate transporter [Pseudohyphozyma bogoriensis]